MSILNIKKIMEVGHMLIQIHIISNADLCQCVNLDHYVCEKVNIK